MRYSYNLSTTTSTSIKLTSFRRLCHHLSENIRVSYLSSHCFRLFRRFSLIDADASSCAHCIMKISDEILFRGNDVDWRMDPYHCSQHLRGRVVEWKREHSRRHNVTSSIQPPYSARCWTCRDLITKAFSCEQCRKKWCQTCYERYLEMVPMSQKIVRRVLTSGTVDRGNIISCPISKILENICMIMEVEC